MSHQHKLTNIYGNWHMLAPTGELLARCDDKRANWYVSRGLATQLDDRTIKLTFVPGGGIEKSNIPYMLEEKANICVVCGSEHELTRHHVVPYQYRKEFPLEYKSKSSYDVLPLCIDHHEEYETHAQVYGRKLEEDLGLEVGIATFRPEDRELMRLRGFANALMVNKSKIPTDRVEFMEQALIGKFGHANVQVVLDETKQPHAQGDPDRKHNVLIVRAVMEKNALQGFVEGWRQHFIDTMQPKFLSPLWTVTQPIEPA
jgi:exonuclease 3'-5' domain-containing protein 2